MALQVGFTPESGIPMVGGLGSMGAERGGVAFWAHIGGFVAGAVLVMVFRDPKLLQHHPYRGWSGRSPSRSWRRIGR